MPFYSLQLNNYRNLENNTLNLSYPEVFFVGKNGQGKTNLLESLYLSSYGNSFKTKSDKELCKIGESSYSVKVLYNQDESMSHTVSVAYNGKEKVIKKNLKKITDRRDLISTIPCILFSHDDMEFANGPMQKRRFFLDQTLSLCSSEYLDILRNYNKIIKSRNLCIKSGNIDLLDTIDEQLCEYGFRIVDYRDKMVKLISDEFSSSYSKISQIDNVSIVYKSSWQELTASEIKDYLKEKRQRDIQLGTSMSGIQRDKIYFMKDGKLYTMIASTGQIRLLTLVLRLVQTK